MFFSLQGLATLDPFRGYIICLNHLTRGIPKSAFLDVCSSKFLLVIYNPIVEHILHKNMCHSYLIKHLLGGNDASPFVGKI